jgi:hypothetical protein
MCRCTCIKIRVEMPDDHIEAVRQHVGPQGFSEYIVNAVEERHRHDLLGELIDELVAEYGPLDEELVRQAAREWPDYEDE